MFAESFCLSNSTLLTKAQRERYTNSMKQPDKAALFGAKIVLSQIYFVMLHLFADYAN